MTAPHAGSSGIRRRRSLIGLAVLGMCALVIAGLFLVGRAVIDGLSYSGCEDTWPDGSVKVDFPNNRLVPIGAVDRLPTDGDVIVALDRADWETSLVPLHEGVAGDPMPLTTDVPVSLSPDGRYLIVARKEYTGDREIIRLSDLTVVAVVGSNRLTFTGSDALVAFGASRRCGPGEIVRVDLAASTQERQLGQFEQSVSPLYVVDGDIALCLEKEFEGGSGPSCERAVWYDPVTGDQRDLDVDDYVLTDPPAQWIGGDVYASVVLGDQVVYWWDADETDQDIAGVEPLRLGSPTGPTATDFVGMTPLDTPSMLLPIEGGRAVIAELGTGKRSWAVCRLPDLRCTNLPSQYQPGKWDMIGAVPAGTIGNG